MRVFDCFTYLEEATMVKARVAEWADIPNVTHVLVEGDHTFTGRPKPLLSHRLGDVPRLSCHTIALPERAASPWLREWAQRDHIYNCVAGEQPDPDDLIFLCDADEIIRSEKFDEIIDATEEGPATLLADVYVYDIYHRLPIVWAYPKALRWRDAFPHLSSLRASGCMSKVEEAAWHFSYFGGARVIGRKLLSFSHTEFSGPQFHDPEFIERRIAADVHITGEALFTGDWDLPPHIVKALSDPIEP